MNISKKIMKGFSLLEILISLAIIVIMTGTLIMSRNNRGATEVQLAAREIAAQLRLLQNDALNGKVIDEDIICEAEMYFDITNNKYQIKYFKEPCPHIDDQTLKQKEEFTPRKSKLNLGSLTEGSISFSAPMGKVKLNLGGPNGVLLESERDPDQKMVVCVNNSGNIEEFKGDDRNCAGPAMCVSNAGDPCNSAANACNQTNAGTVQCDGQCSVATPPNPTGYGDPCNSAANACNQTNAGTVQCNGQCSAAMPPNPTGYGDTCWSAYNGCWDRNPGTIQCNGLCSAVVPPNPPFLNKPCTWVNSCGLAKPGKYMCNAHCNSEGNNSGCGTHLMWGSAFGGVSLTMWDGIPLPPLGGIATPFGTLFGCGVFHSCYMPCIIGQIYWNYCVNLDSTLYYCYNNCV